ncbi:MAG: DUF2283 domain-containing protein [Opitutaceae bacterium]|nr:DUF2283 domain-containing protein [Opitutaceae bacterium]
MKIKYFEDTDTALFEFGGRTPVQTKEFSEDIYLHLDAAGHVVSITVEHASEHSDLTEVTFHRMSKAAQTAG